ncbi:uncharacterized protein LOC132737316 [Ruditapes philippinarum]|uniref:uncharacterized protein LOC132737316 n=1 Tax=Ruditapes philippinarum TaxID=129788 RepID=UPI00295C19A4|nr:uncharacterized protein LOC132737316 [Ruditapes philippinarum]
MDGFLYIYSTILMIILLQGNTVIATDNSSSTSTNVVISTVNVIPVVHNTTTEKTNTTNTKDRDNFLVYILVPAAILALVGFVILTVLIVRCFRAVHEPEDVDHLTRKDYNETTEHHMFGLFNKSYKGIDSDDHLSAKDNSRKRSIFELNESHAIKRSDPAYVDIDIPIDVPSSEEEKFSRGANDNNNHEIANKTYKRATAISEFSTLSGNPNYNHIQLRDEEDVYNRLTLKNTDQRATQHTKSTFNDEEYVHSAVNKSYKTFEDSYSRLSSVVPRKNPFLRLSEVEENNVGTKSSAQLGLGKEAPDSSENPRKTYVNSGKQTTKSDKLQYNYSKVKKTRSADIKHEAVGVNEQVTLNVNTLTKSSKPETEKCSNKYSDSGNSFDVSPDCSNLVDKNGYSIVNKRKCLNPESKPNTGNEDNYAIQSEIKSGQNIKHSKKDDDYCEVIKKSNKSVEDFHYSGIEINTDKFFIVTDS